MTALALARRPADVPANALLQAATDLYLALHDRHLRALRVDAAYPGSVDERAAREALTAYRTLLVMERGR